MYVLFCVWGGIWGFVSLFCVVVVCCCCLDCVCLLLWCVCVVFVLWCVGVDVCVCVRLLPLLGVFFMGCLFGWDVCACCVCVCFFWGDLCVCLFFL